MSAAYPDVPHDDGVDFDHANAARMYDYFLGGGHNFAVDREQTKKVLAGYPDAARAARANRAFLGQVVRTCIDHGIDQFLDLGSGVPTVGNVHEIAHSIDPGARVAYVDFEPVAVAHAADIVQELDTVTASRADLRRPVDVLSAPGVAGLLDFDRPVALLMVAVLPFVSDGAAQIVEQYRRALAPRSALAISHGSDDHEDPELAARMHAMIEAYRDSATALTLRTRSEIRALFGPLEPISPGLVDITDWPDPRPDVDPVSVYGGLAFVDTRPA